MPADRPRINARVLALAGKVCRFFVSATLGCGFSIHDQTGDSWKLTALPSLAFSSGLARSVLHLRFVVSDVRGADSDHDRPNRRTRQFHLRRCNSSLTDELGKPCLLMPVSCQSWAQTARQARRLRIVCHTISDSVRPMPVIRSAQSVAESAEPAAFDPLRAFAIVTRHAFL
jgi:hypothetical protein